MSLLSSSSVALLIRLHPLGDACVNQFATKATRKHHRQYVTGGFNHPKLTRISYNLTAKQKFPTTSSRSGRSKRFGLPLARL